MRNAKIEEKSEIAHLIEKTPQSVIMMLLVGVLLSLTISGSLMNLETYAKCNTRYNVGPRSMMNSNLNHDDYDDGLPRSVMYWQANDDTMDLVCFAAENKVSTVIILVWVPILLYCVFVHYKTTTVRVIEDEEIVDDEDGEEFPNLSISFNEDASSFSNLLYPDYFYNYEGFI